MTTGNYITNFDFKILDFIADNIRCEVLDPIMAGITHFADAGIGWILLGVILLIPKKTRIWGAMALVAMVIGFLCGDIILKNLFCRVRPYNDYIMFHQGNSLPFLLNAGKESSYSFPSGHTCCSFASAIVYFIANKKWGIPALIFASLIGFSRMYNYVHYPTDVFAGMLLGIGCGLLAWYLFKKFQVNKKLKVKPVVADIKEK